MLSNALQAVCSELSLTNNASNFEMLSPFFNALSEIGNESSSKLRLLSLSLKYEEHLREVIAVVSQEVRVE